MPDGMRQYIKESAQATLAKKTEYHKDMNRLTKEIFKK